MTREDSALRAALGRSDLPPGLERWRARLAPGDTRVTEGGEWAGALVLVERGELEIECTDGGRRRFIQGDLLALDWLPLRMLHSRGTEPVELLAVRRRPT